MEGLHEVERHGPYGPAPLGAERVVELPGIWLTTPGEIASHYAGITPAEAALSGVVTRK